MSKSSSPKSNYLYDFPDENPNGVISFDSKLNLLYSNIAAKKHFISDFHIINKVIKDKEFKKEISAFLKSKKAEILFHKERNGRIYSIAFKRIRPQNYVHVYTTDISSYILEIKNKDKELEKLSLLAKRTNNGVLTLDKNKKITWANQSFIKRSGYSINELLNKNPLTFIHKSTDKKILLNISKKMNTPEMVREEILHKAKQGDFYWIDLTINPLYNNEGKHSGYMMVEFDITDRKQSEQIIQEQNKSLLEITDALDQTSLVAISSLNGTIVRVNDNFLKLSKFTNNELIGAGFNILNSGYHPAKFWDVMWRTIKKGEIWRSEIRNKAKDGSFFWIDLTIHPIYNNKKEIIHYLTIGYDISPRKEVQQSLIDTTKFQDLLMKISSVYINIPLDTLEEKIVESLEIIGNFINVDRVYVFAYNHEKQCASNLFEWCAKGIIPQMHTLQEIPFDTMPIWRKRHFKGQEIHIPDIQKLARGKFRKIIESQEIKSLISIPMMDMDAEKCLGFVGFDSVRLKRFYTDEEKGLLKLYAQMLVNVSNRVDHIKQIEQSKNKIEEINSNLEQLVIEKTKKNLQLSRSIANQEKLVTIGEISAGIAHDLNTPLGAIKIGAESVLYSLQGLYEGVLSRSSKKELDFAFDYATKLMGDKELFIGGLKARKEKKNAYEFLLKREFKNVSDIEKFADFMVKNRVDINDEVFLNVVLKSPSPLAFMELIYHTIMLRSFIDTIIVSGEKAAKVVQDLRSFIKDPAVIEKKEVNLKKSIATVLNIFNYELKKNIDVKFDVDETLAIKGYDIKLFQLWSNLIKNAIESMEGINKAKKLSIYGLRNNQRIELVFENNGPVINKAILKQIFDKFFTTKSHKNGTGLGLSIVKNVVDEHDAKITVDSKRGKTKFIIYFPIRK